MRNKIAVSGILGVLVLLLAPGVALAEGTNCLFSTILVPDGRVLQSTFPATTTFFFAIFAAPGRSYSVEVTSATAAFDAAFLPLIVQDFFDCPGGPALASVRDTQVIEPKLDNIGRTNMQRFSFSVPSATIVTIEVQNVTAAPRDYTISVSDTTQFNPGWSTGGGGAFQTFYSIQNTTNASCTVILTLVNNSGTTVGTTTQAIAAGRLLGTNTTALGVPAGQSGIGRLTHDCPPGGILSDAAIINFSTSPAAIIPSKFLPARESTH